MIVGTDDTAHLVHEIGKDIPYLVKKAGLIIKKIRSRIGKKSPLKVAYRNRHAIKWKNLSKQTEWQIFYYVPVGLKEQKINFVSITHIDTAAGRQYILIENTDNSEAHIQVFWGHLVKRLSERTDMQFETAEEALSIFILEGEFSYFNYWEYESKEMRHLNKWGITMGKYDACSRVLTHKTILMQEQLNKNQEAWVKDFLKCVIINNLIPTNHSLYKYYEKYLEPDDLKSCNSFELAICCLKNLSPELDLDDPKYKYIIEELRKDLELKIGSEISILI